MRVVFIFVFCWHAQAGLSPSAKLFVFGSTTTGLNLPGSDIDAVIVGLDGGYASTSTIAFRFCLLCSFFVGALAHCDASLNSFPSPRVLPVPCQFARSQRLRRVARTLQQRGVATNIEIIGKARVPLIKFDHPVRCL